MPRLLRTVARTAVISGTAQAVGGRVAHRQANRWQQQEQQAYQQQAPPPPAPAAPAAPAPSSDDMLAKLTQLGELKANGVLTEAEFEAQKAKILAGL